MDSLFVISSVLYIAILLDVSIGEKTALLVKQVKQNRSAPIKLHTGSVRTMILFSDMILDRSLLIKELLEHHHKRLIIACPPKWSKSINLNMLKLFLQAEIDPKNGEIRHPNQSFGYNLFVKGEISNGSGNESFKRPFLISQHQDIIEQHLGQYPIVYLRFKFLEGLNDIEALGVLKTIIKEAYMPHRYMSTVLINYYRSTDFNDTVKRKKIQTYFTRFKNILDETEDDRDTLVSSLDFLCKMLYRHHRRRAVVLIDDYDSPFYKFLHSVYFSESDTNFVLRSMQALVGPIIAEDYPFVERAYITVNNLITDIMGPAGKSMPNYTLADNPWLEYFGMSDRDLMLICNEVGKSDARCESAIAWYMGYKSQVNDNLNLGSPFTTAYFLAENNIKLFLFHKIRYDYLFEFIRIRKLREIFHSLINNGVATIESFNNLRFSKSELIYLKGFSVTGSSRQIQQSDVDLALSYLCAFGYLTFAKSNTAVRTTRVWLPNTETLTEVCRKLKAYYFAAYGLTYNFIETMVQRLRDYIVREDDKHLDELNNNLNDLFFNSALRNFTQLPTHTTQYLDDLINAALNYISMKMRSVWKFQTVVWRNTNSSASFMLGMKKSYGYIIAAQYNESPETLWTLAKRQKPLLRKNTHLRIYKFIGFTVDPNRTVHMKTNSEYMYKR